MELPIEIIYEISIQNPFKSFMPFLSKTTKKYWEDRFLRIIGGNFQTKSTAIDLIDWEKISTFDPNLISETLSKLLSNAKFLRINISPWEEYDIARITKLMKNLVSVDVHDRIISRDNYNTLNAIKIVNYRYQIKESDRDIILSKFPEFIYIFDNPKITDNCILCLDIINDKIVVMVLDGYLDYEPISVFNCVEHIEITYVPEINDIDMIFHNIKRLDNLRTCKFWISETEEDNESFQYIKKIVSEKFPGKKFSYIDRHIEIVF